MEDELEDRLFYQTYQSHMKMVSKVFVGLSVNQPLGQLGNMGHLWRMLRLYLLRSEVIIFSVALFIFLMYLQAVDVWSRTLLSRLGYAVGRRSLPTSSLRLLEPRDSDKQSWELIETISAAYALKGRRPQMEDRFVINENIDDSGVSLFAIYDGHGGNFAADYAKNILTEGIYNKIISIKNIMAGKVTEADLRREKGTEKTETEKGKTTESLDRKKSFKKTCSTYEDCAKREVTDNEILNRLNMNRPITRDVRPSPTPVKTVSVPLSEYIEGNKINYSKLITDEVLAADQSLVAEAKKSFDVAGTTALLVVLEGDQLTVANVGDSRAVMCDAKGNAIPLSFDHKPQQMREQKRIKEAGGYIAFHGVWRVAGILATSRALGDYPLKDKKFVIPDPDILTFNMTDHKPLFVILASDGLWDTFSNEEAVNFIKDRLNEPHYGAKSLVLQSYYRGSVDNISIIIINLKDKQLVSSSLKA